MPGSDQQRLLVLSNVWVEPTASAAGWRMERLLDSFLAHGYRIDYATTATPSALAIDLPAKGIATHHIRVNDDAFDAFLLECAPDVVLFDRFMVEEQFGWRVAEHLPKAVRVLDSEDLHGLRYAREAALNAGRPFQASDLHREIMFRELAAIHRCDLTLVISSFEMNLLKEQFNVAPNLLFYMPFQLSQSSIDEVERMPLFDARTDFVSIGNFKHAPNRDAVKALKEELWPRIRQALPEARLQVYGAYAGQHVMQWHDSKQGFLVNGHAPSAGQVLKKARVLLAPLRFGAGLKGKLVDAMRFGLPSITTSIGAEGIGEAATWPGAICDDWSAFADQAIQYYKNDSVWQDARDKMKPLLDDRFGNAELESASMQRIAEIKLDLAEHRNKNWVGGMLQLNSQKSYRYLSKWIMAKASR